MSDSETAWRAVARADFTQWHGLAVPAPYAEFERQFPRLYEQESRVLLGRDHIEARYRIHDGQRYPQHLWVAYVDADVVLIEAQLPDLAQPVPDLTGTLGEPQARLDTQWGVLRIPGGLRVYPERGLALAIGPEGQVLRIELFAAGDLDTYQNAVRHIEAPMTERP